MNGVYEPIRIVEIDGVNLPEDISDNVESFTYEDHEDKMDELTLVVYDEKLAYCDHPMLQEGREVRARWGYIGRLSEVRTCTIKEIDYDFTEDGTAMIHLTAYDKGHKLTGRSSRKCWSNAKVETVVNDIAEKHNLTPVVDIPNDFDREFFSQGGENDFVFLKKLAAEMGCKMWVQNEELHFQRNEASGDASHVFHYRVDATGTLKSVSIKSNAEKGKGTGRETEVAGIDPIKKKPFQETATAKEDDVTINLGDGRERNETPHRKLHDETGLSKATPSHTPTEAKQEAKGRVKSEGMGTVEANAVIIGTPDLKAKQIIRIEGISKKFSGLWRVKSVRHMITSGGYECELEIARSDSNAGSSKLSEGGKAAGGGGSAGQTDGTNHIEVDVG